MVVEVLEGSLESQVIHLLMEMYPVTAEDVERELKARPGLVDRTLKALEQRGIVELEPLPDRTYVRLLRFDFEFVGRKESQQRRVKHSGRKRGKPKDYEGPMFG